MPAVQLLSNQFKGFTALNLPVRECVTILGERLKRYGEVMHAECEGLEQAIAQTVPLKSFGDRIIAVENAPWTLLLTNHLGENASSDGCMISHSSECKGIGIHSLETRREIILFDHGEVFRSVRSLRDGDRWQFLELGVMTMFENAKEYARKRKADRLSVSAVKSCFEAFTGIPFPRWSDFVTSNWHCLTRSTQTLEVKTICFPTIVDICMEPGGE